MKLFNWPKANQKRIHEYKCLVPTRLENGDVVVGEDVVACQMFSGLWLDIHTRRKTEDPLVFEKGFGYDGGITNKAKSRQRILDLEKEIIDLKRAVEEKYKASEKLSAQLSKAQENLKSSIQASQEMTLAISDKEDRINSIREEKHKVEGEIKDLRHEMHVANTNAEMWKERLSEKTKASQEDNTKRHKAERDKADLKGKLKLMFGRYKEGAEVVGNAKNLGNYYGRELKLDAKEEDEIKKLIGE